MALRLTERELLAYRAEIKLSIFDSIVDRYRAKGEPRALIATRLGKSENEVTEIMKGQLDKPTLEDLSDLARALDCRIVAGLQSLD